AGVADAGRRARPFSLLAMAAAMRGQSDLVWRAIAGLFVVFLLSPLVLVVLFSFTSRAQSAAPIESLSRPRAETKRADRRFPRPLWNGVIMSGAVGVLSAIIGTMAAMALARLEPSRARRAAAMLCLPLMVPPLVLGVTLLPFYSKTHFPMGRQT